MKFFSHHSGQATIAPSFFGSSTRSTVLEQPAEAPTRREDAGATVRAATQHCRFICKWCESPILLPHDKLGLPFASPFLRKVEARAIATVCSACNHVGGFSLFRGTPGYDTRNNLVMTQPVGQTILLDWLQCEEPTCSFALPLFISTEEELTGERAKDLAASWLWGELSCASTHRVKAPLWIFSGVPYALPTPIK